MAYIILQFTPQKRILSSRKQPTRKIGQVQLPLKLNIDTTQFGRTFQDRSHVFKLVPRRKAISEDDIIYNLNVRGKRGNIVQVYPAVEYDFIPKRLNISNTSLVHIQWTGKFALRQKIFNPKHFVQSTRKRLSLQLVIISNLGSRVRITY